MFNDLVMLNNVKKDDTVSFKKWFKSFAFKDAYVIPNSDYRDPTLMDRFRDHASLQTLHGTGTIFGSLHRKIIKFNLNHFMTVL